MNPHFEIDHWIRFFPLDAVPEHQRTGQDVTGPRSLAIVEQIRRQAGMSRFCDKSCPADVFVIGIGEPDEPWCTRIGGIPFRPVGKIWPRDKGGNNMTFLAQFDFRQSMDLFSDLPGDILQVFTKEYRIPDDMDPDFLRFEWLKRNEISNCEKNMPEELEKPVPSFFGIRYRTVDYHDDTGTASGIRNYINSEYPDEIATACRFFGLKIGGLPSWVWMNNIFQSQRTLLCTITTIIPDLDIAYPFINRIEEFSSKKDIQSLGKWSFFYSPTVAIYLFLDRVWGIVWHCEFLS